MFSPHHRYGRWILGGRSLRAAREDGKITKPPIFAHSNHDPLPAMAQWQDARTLARDRLKPSVTHEKSRSARSGAAAAFIVVVFKRNQLCAGSCKASALVRQGPDVLADFPHSLPGPSSVPLGENSPVNALEPADQNGADPAGKGQRDKK